MLQNLCTLFLSALAKLTQAYLVFNLQKANVFVIKRVLTLLYINQEKGKILLNEDSYQRNYFAAN